MADAYLTDAGRALYASLLAGSVPSPFYGTLVLGRGNSNPGASDKVSSITKRIPIQVEASPVRDHGNVLNPGRGADVWTWEFEISAPSTPWVATNVALGPNPLVSTTALAMHAADDIMGDPYRRLLVWMNLGNGTATITHTHVTDPVQAAKLRSTGARADVLFGGPRSQVLRVGEVVSSVRAGESVPLRGRIYGEDGQPLVPSDVRRVTRKMEEYEAGPGRWVARRSAYLDACVLQRASSSSSALFPYRGGFNFATKLEGSATRDGVNKRLTYRIELCDGNERVIRQTVRVAGD